jgi:pSer/pThr/pTyr-binding forkhead associated (FHA) protein
MTHLSKTDGPPTVVPGRDTEGFVDVATLHDTAQKLTAKAFATVYTAPALLTVGLNREVAPVAHEMTPRSGARLASIKRTILSGSSAVAPEAATKGRSYSNRVAFLVKRPGNLFPQMITVGRAMNNDVLFLLDTVSKFHGYFTTREGPWEFTDQRSSNGTTVNGAKLPEGKSRVLADGDRLSFGGTIEVAFLLPESLHAKLLARR